MIIRNTSLRMIIMRMLTRANNLVKYYEIICQVVLLLLHILVEDYIVTDIDEREFRDIKLNSCSKCGLHFMSLYQLAHHKNAIHIKQESEYSSTNAGLLIRTKCSNYEIKVTNLKEVRLDLDTKKLIHASVKKERNYFENLEENISTNDGIQGKSFKCSKCNETFESLKGLADHKNAQHINLAFLEESLNAKKLRNSTQCTECKNVFSTKRLLRNHIITQHTKEFPIFCDFCGKGYTRQDFWRHQKSCKSVKEEKTYARNAEGEIIWPCDKCSKIFRKSSQLYRHLKKHTKAKDFPCLDCSVVYADKRNLINHVNLNHPSSISQFGIGCDLCLERFSTKSNMEYHKVESHGESFYKLCENCGKGFIKRDYLGRMEAHKKVCLGKS